MSLVKVWTDVGGRKPVALLAKIVERDGVILTIRYLTAGKDKVWRYENDTYDIEDESVAEYLNTGDETKVGFLPCDDGFLHESETDEDYDPPDEDEESDEESDDDDEFDEDDNEEEYEDSNEDDEEESEGEAE
jgi:hypothetical protein